MNISTPKKLTLKYIPENSLNKKPKEEILKIELNNGTRERWL